MSKNIFLSALTLSLSVSLSGYSYALSPINSVNDGRIIQGGTYFNTANGQTTFTNTNGGLWLKTSTNLRGVEVNSSGNLTNNGGTFNFYAPGQVVRLDGNVDVRGVKDASGIYLGNGGKVFVDAAYLYQSGKIYASGSNGGLVQFNVGAASVTGNARIEANGTGQGTGGVISINASGPVDIQRQVVLDTSGRVAGTFDTNVINIEGGLVNVEGTIRANGLVAETDDISPGGTIRLVSTGQTDLTQAQQAIQNAVTGGTFSGTEASAINSRLSSLKSSNDGDVAIAAATATAGQAVLEARGGFGLASGNDPTDPTPRAGDGGTIIVTAQRNIQNGGLLNASGGQGNPYPLPDGLNHLSNGGNGGTVSLNAGKNITNTGRIMANGGDAALSVDLAHGLNGGTGGLIALAYGNQMQNAGVVSTNGGSGAFDYGLDGNGGNGGLAVLSGPGNPTDNGYIVTNGGIPGSSIGGGPSHGHFGQLGTIVAPNPVTASNILIGKWRTTDSVEMLVHNENLILLGNSLSTNQNLSDLSDGLTNWTTSAHVRSVIDPIGEVGDERGQAENEFGVKASATTAYPFRNFIFTNSRNTPVYFFNPNELTRGFNRTFPIANYNTMTALSVGYIGLGTAVGDVSAIQFGNGMGGGHFSLISSSIGQIYPLYVNGGVAGGSINLSATDNIITGGALGPMLTKNFMADGSLHGGSIVMKAGQKVDSLDSGNGLLTVNGGLTGGTVQLLSQNLLTNFGSILANGTQTGGSILLQAGNTLSNYSDRSTTVISANGGSYGGNIKLKAPTIQSTPSGFFPISLQATGSVQNGKITTEN